MNDKKNESITPRDVDFAKWYTDVVRAADTVYEKASKDSESAKLYTVDYYIYGYI